MFPEISKFGVKSKELSKLIAKYEHIYVYLSSNYGIVGEYHLRICFANPRDLLEILIKRLRRFVNNWDNIYTMR